MMMRVALWVAIVAWLATGQAALAQGPPPGATCTVQAFKADGKKGPAVKFKATKDGQILTMGGKPLGSWTAFGDGFVLNITGGGNMNGSYRFMKHPKVPKGWLAEGARGFRALHLTVAK